GRIGPQNSTRLRIRLNHHRRRRLHSRFHAFDVPSPGPQSHAGEKNVQARVGGCGPPVRVHHVRQGAPCPGPANRKQTLRLNNGRYGYSGELAQYSSNQNRRWCCASEADSVDSTPPIPAKVPRSGRAPSLRLPSLLASEQYQSLLDRLTFILQVLRTQTGRLGWPSGAFPTDLEKRRRTLILVTDVGEIECGTNTPLRMRFVYIHYSTAPPVPTALTGLRENGIAKRSLIGLPRATTNEPHTRFDQT
ncbi:hypothetical protein CPAR01_07877, partial [Colletotrichum paranaense]